MKKEKSTKVAVKADNAIAVYRLLTTPKTPERDGVKLSTLDTKDIFKVLRAVNVLKPVAVAFDDFHKDVRERLKPDGWDEKVQKYSEATDREKAESDRIAAEYANTVNECIATELEKIKEVDAYEHLGEEALGKLIQANAHLFDLREAMLLQEVLG